MPPSVALQQSTSSPLKVLARLHRGRDRCLVGVQPQPHTPALDLQRPGLQTLRGSCIGRLVQWCCPLICPSGILVCPSCPTEPQAAPGAGALRGCPDADHGEPASAGLRPELGVQLVGTVRALQDNMQSVMKRLSRLETLTPAQVRPGTALRPQAGPRGGGVQARHPYAHPDTGKMGVGSNGHWWTPWLPSSKVRSRGQDSSTGCGDGLGKGPRSTHCPGSSGPGCRRACALCMAGGMDPASWSLGRAWRCLWEFGSHRAGGEQRDNRRTETPL